jgi:hypothetical protein
MQPCVEFLLIHKQICAKQSDDDGDFYSVTLAFRQTIGNKADGSQ